MRQSVVATAVVLLAVWLQLNFFGGLRPLWILPNVMLIVVTYLALQRPASQTLLLSLLGGLLLDLASGTDFGLRMAFYSFYALVVMFARQAGVSHESLGTAAVLVA